MKEYYINKYSLKNIIVIRNLRQKKDFQNIKGNSVQKKVLISSSMLDNELEHYLELIKHVNLKYKFYFVLNNNIQKEKIRNFIKKNNLKNVIIRSYFFGESLIEMQSQFDVCWVHRRDINLNYKFSLPNRIGEAIASNLPIIYSGNCPTIRNLIIKFNLGKIYNGTLEDFYKQLNNLCEPEYIGIYKQNFENRKKKLCWENEIENFRKALINYKVQKKNKVCLVCIKNIENHDRLKRLSKTLLDLNFKVDIICKKKPRREFSFKNIKYLELKQI